MNLEIKNLSLLYDEEKYIFKDLSINIDPGELVVIKGKNGSGKTSLLRSIANLIKFSNNNNYELLNLKGEIICSNINIFENKEIYFYTRSFIPSYFELCEEFDLFFYLDFWNKSIENSKIESEKMILSVIKYFNFEKFIFKNLNHQDLFEKNNILITEIKNLSSGYKKRVQYSRLLFENRAIWILDEPLNFLDNDGRNLIINMINSKILSGGIVILSDNTTEEFLNINSNNIKYINL